MVKKRRMPAHIVLPNGMWRFVKSGTKKKARTRTARVAKHRSRHLRRVSYMVRHRKTHRSVSGFGGVGLAKGIFRPKGIVAAAVLGVGTAAVANSILGGEKFPYQSEVLGFATGGIVGAGANFLLKNMHGIMGGTSASSGLY